MANTSPRIAANAPILDPAQLAQTTALYGPQGLQLTQKSRYLAQALDDMRQQSQNIRTPVALGSDLLAEALLQSKYGKTNAALNSAYATQQQAAQNVEREQLGLPPIDTPAPQTDGGGASANPVASLFGGVGHAAHQAWNGVAGLFGGGGSASGGNQDAGASAPGSQANPASPGGTPQDPGYAPEGRPGPVQVSSAPQGTPTPSNPLPRVDGTAGSSATGSTSQPSTADMAQLLSAAGGGGPYASIGPVSPAAQQLAAALAAGRPGAPQASAGAPMVSAGAPQTIRTPDANTPPPAPSPDYAPNFGDPHQDAAGFFSAALGGRPVTITSGFRTPQQNAAVGGSPTSSHLTGNAWDFTVPGMSSADTVAALRASGIPFDQIIDEGQNVHVGMDPRMRGQILTGSNGHYQVVGQQPPGATGSAAAATSSAQPAPGVGATQPGAQPGARPAPQAAATAGAVQPPPGAPQGQTWRIVDTPPPGGQWNVRNGVAYGLLPSDEEKRQVQAYWANPLTKAQGDALAQQIIQRTRTPLAYKQEISRDGQILMTPETPGTGPTYLGEAAGYTLPAEARIVRQPDNSYAPVRGATYGAPQGQPGMVGEFQRGPDNKLYRAGEPPYGNPYTIPGYPGLFINGPDGKPQAFAQPSMTMEQVRSAREGYFNSKVATDYMNTLGAVNSLHDMFQKATGNNGILDMAAFDNLYRAESGLSARQGGVQMLMDHIGVPQEIQGHILKLTGNGVITPQVLQQIDSTLQSYGSAQGRLAQHRLDSDTAWIKKNGGQDLGIELPQMTPTPNVAWLNGGQDPGSAATPPQRPAAAAAQPQPGVSPQGGQGAPGVPSGARRAPDGNWYVPDPNRAGKYLRVVH